MSTIRPSKEQIDAFRAADRNQPVVMLNLLKYRISAIYAEDSGRPPCSGREAYQRYGAVAAEKVAELGGRIVAGAKAEQTFIGDADKTWDDVVFVYYPSRAAFFEMQMMPDYQAALVHRDAGLEDTLLIQCDGKQLNHS